MNYADRQGRRDEWPLLEGFIYEAIFVPEGFVHNASFLQLSL